MDTANALMALWFQWGSRTGIVNFVFASALANVSFTSHRLSHSIICTFVMGWLVGFAVPACLAQETEEPKPTPKSEAMEPSELDLHIMAMCEAMEQRDVEQIIKAFENADTIPDVPSQVRWVLGKTECCIGIQRGDATVAEPLFKQMVRAATNDELPLAKRRSLTVTIGFLCGLLEEDTSETIPRSILQRTQEVFEDEDVKNLRGSFTTAVEQGRKRKQAILETMDDLRGKSESEWNELLDGLRSERESLQSDRDETIDSVQEEHADYQSAYAKKFKSRGRLVADLNDVLVDINTPTAGHPGDPPVPPVKPHRSQVSVNEYETKREKRGDRWETVKVKRDHADIERDKDREYHRLLDRYSSDKQRYDRDSDLYKNAMAAWIQRDQIRRTKLANDRMELIQKIETLDAEKREYEAKKKESMENVREMDDRLKQIGTRLEISESVIEALRSKDPDRAFRANAWAAIDFPSERSALMSWLRNHD